MRLLVCGAPEMKRRGMGQDADESGSELSLLLGAGVYLRRLGAPPSPCSVKILCKTGNGAMRGRKQR